MEYPSVESVHESGITIHKLWENTVYNASGESGAPGIWEKLSLLPKTGEFEGFWAASGEDVHWKIPLWCGLERIEENSFVWCRPVYESLHLQGMLHKINKAFCNEKIRCDVMEDIEKAVEAKKVVIQPENASGTATGSILSAVIPEYQEIICLLKQIARFFPGKLCHIIPTPAASNFEQKSQNYLFQYALEMPTLYEIYVSSVLRLKLSDSPYQVVTQEVCQVFPQDTGDNYMSGIYIPDIQIRDESGRTIIIYDVKYKNGEINKYTREDRLQILAYAYMKEVTRIGHIFPEKQLEPTELQLRSNKTIMYRELRCNCTQPVDDILF